MPIAIEVVRDGSTRALSFPEFEEGSRLHELIQQIAAALDTMARPPKGSPLELLVEFQGYPDAFALWWDGSACELGCAEDYDVDLDDVARRLIKSGAFTFG